METFNYLVKLFFDNVEWIFSGIGIFIFSLFIKNRATKKQRSGDNSNNYMADRDIIIGKKNDK